MYQATKSATRDRTRKLAGASRPKTDRMTILGRLASERNSVALRDDGGNRGN